MWMNMQENQSSLIWVIVFYFLVDVGVELGGNAQIYLSNPGVLCFLNHIGQFQYLINSTDSSACTIYEGG